VIHSCPFLALEVSWGQTGRKGTKYQKEPGNRSSIASQYFLPNILLHHYPGVKVDHSSGYFLVQWPIVPQQGLPNPKGFIYILWQLQFHACASPSWL
jgi:hypothetical protein